MEDVFGKGTVEGSRPLLPPGNCWICDNSPQQEEMKVIDTRRNTQAGGALSHLSNRKYICEPCARQMGGALGMVSQEDYDEAIREGRKLEQEVAILQGDLALCQNAQTRVVSIDEVEAFLKMKELPEPKPTPAKRTPPAQK